MELNTPSTQLPFRTRNLSTPVEPVRSTVDKEKDVKYHNVDCDIARVSSAGGDCEDRAVLDSIDKGHISYKQATLPLDRGARMVKSDYEILQNKFSRLDCPITLNPSEATFDDIAMHALYRQRLSPGTVDKRLRYARFMEKHQVPIDFRNPSYTNFIRHMDYREQVEQCTFALSNEWKTMKMFLKAYGMPIWDYRPPLCPKNKARYIPLPDTVYKMIHFNYSSDDYKNALIQYTLLNTFMIGWRNPSETCILTVDDIDFENKTLRITEPKKHRSTRMIVPEYSLLDGKNRKSLKYWIDHWRPKVENQYSDNALYLKPDGHPFEKEQYRMFMTRMVKPFFPRYQPKISRHWCAIAQLIKTKIKTNHFDVYQVRNWLGHSEIQTTMGYISDSEQYYKLAPYDWFQRVLKYYMIEENTKKSVQWSKGGVLTKISPRNRSGPTGIRTPVTGSEGQ